MRERVSDRASAYSRESFECGDCGRHFEASVATWVDVARAPQARHALLKRQFNVIQCTHCGGLHFSGTPFFYEDFEEGLLIAVFPEIPDGRTELEISIRGRYGYYPVLEFFYDMTQLWMLLYFQEQYKANSSLRRLSRIGEGEGRLRAILRFLKENRLMIDIREKLAETFLKTDGSDELADLLGQALYLLEQMHPWPMDHRCICGADLSATLSCCGKPIRLEEHERLLSRQYVIYCPRCKESLSGAGCKKCRRVYTWKLGTVASYRREGNKGPLARRTGDDDQISAADETL